MGVEFISVKATLLQAVDKVTFEPALWFLLDREKPQELARRNTEPEMEEEKKTYPYGLPLIIAAIQERAIGFSFSFVHPLGIGVDFDEPLGGIEHDVEQASWADSVVGQDIAQLAEMVQAFLDVDPTCERDGKMQSNNTVSFLTAWEWSCWRCGGYEYPDEWDCGGGLLGWVDISPDLEQGLKVVSPGHLKEYLAKRSK